MAERTQIKLQELTLPIAVVVIVLMIIIPLHAVLLDMFMVANLMLTILVLIITITSRKVTDFSQFPTVLLLLTIFSLGINVSSTRLILTQGTRFEGKMVRAFSTFVISARGNQGSSENQQLVIGFVLFIIITAVQVFVITKGAKRTAEVNARYTLDGMSIKQATLESEFNQGAITEDELKKRKTELQLEVDLSRAMDGASNFVSNNAKIGIFITVINLVVGIILGMVLRGEPFGTAVQTYAALTIGDGLLAQIPSLFTSVAAGLLVSRSMSQQSLETDIFAQFSQSATAFYVGGGTILVLGVFPGFPWYVMVPLGASLLFAGRRLGTLNKKKTAADSEEAKKQKQTLGSSPGDVPPVVPLDPLSLEIGFALIPLVDQAKGAELLERVTSIRREAAVDMGLVVPRVRIIDNMRLDPHEYCVKIKGVEVAKSKIRMGWYLCMNMGAVTDEIPGEKTIEPTFGIPAIWITEENREKAERAGYTVVDTPTIIATHLNQIIKTHAAEILGRQDVQLILDAVKKDYPAVVESVLVGEGAFTLGEIQKVLQGLLREQVSIRNNVAILETLADFSKITRDTGTLIEKVRQKLGRQICLQYVDDKKILHIVTIAQDFQKKLLEAPRVNLVDGWSAALDPPTHRAWIEAASSIIAAMKNAGWVPVILCPGEIRPLVRSITERDMPKVVILSIPEVPNDIKIEIVGEIKVG